MAFTRVRGSGITTTDNYIVGVITATKFVGESGGSATFDNVSIGGSLTVNGDFTTLNTTLREVELLQVDANSSTAAGIITQRGSGDILNLYDGSTKVFTAADGGNFGFGTSTIRERIHLHTSNSDEAYLRFTNSTTGTGADDGFNIGIDSAEKALIWNKENTDMLFGTNGETRMTISSDGSQCTIRSDVHDGGLEILAGNNNQESRLKIQGKASNGTEHNWIIGASRSADRFYVSNTTDTHFAILDDGKTGIGIANPTARLHVNGTTNGLQARFGGTGTGLGILCGAKTNANALVTFEAQDSTHGTLTFKTAGDERLRITSAGNVGINDNNPGAQLVVKATTDDNPAIQLYRQSTGGDIASIYWQTGSGTQAKINYRGAAGANEGMQFYTAGGSSSQLRMVIDHSGKVGIGTNDPASLLHTNSSSSNGLMISTPLGDHYIWGIQAAGNLMNGSTAGDLGIRGKSGISISGNNGTATQVRITSAGNVGINMTDPGEKLSVHGKIEARSGNWFIARSGDNSGYAHIKNPETTGSQLAFNTSGEKMRITSGGDVLIGHDTSIEPDGYASHLQVHGTATDAGISILRYSNDTASPTLLFGKSRGASIGAIGEVQDGDSLGKIEFYGTDTDWESSASIRASADGEWYSGSAGSEDNTDAPGRLEFHTTPNGADNMLERMRITSSGQVRIDGSTSANHGLRFTPGGWNGYDNRMGYCGTSGGDFWWSSNWNPTDGSRDHNGYATNFIRQNVPTGYISFGTGGVDASATEKLRITNDGNVLIGSFTPIDTRNTGGIHIQPNHGVSFRAYSSTASRNWRIRNDDFAWGNLDFSVGTSNSDWADDASEMVLSLTSNRRVGINKTVPGASLHIGGPSEIRFDNAADGGNYARIRCFEENSDNGAHLAFNVGIGEALRIQNDGQKIVKNGRLNILSTFIDFSGSISTPSTAAAIYRPADNTLAVSTANTEKLKIDGSGVLYHKPSGNTTNTYLKAEGNSSTYILKSQKDGTADTNISFRVQDGGTLAQLLYLKGSNKTVAIGPDITPARNLHVQEHFLVANKGTNAGQPYVSSTPILAVGTDGSNVVPGDTTYRHNAIVSFGVGGHNAGDPASNSYSGACPALPYFKIDLYGQTGVGDVGTNLDSTLSIRSINPNNTRLRIRTKDNYNGSYPDAIISFTQQQGTELARIHCDTVTSAANQADLAFYTNYGGLYERLRITNTGDLILKNNSGKMIDCRTSSSTGNCWIALSESDGTQKGYFGYGSSNNEQLYIVQQEAADIVIYNGSQSRWFFSKDGHLNSQTDGQINIYGGSGNATNDGRLYVDKTSNADWCIVANAATYDYGIYSRVGNGAAYGLGVYDHSNSTWRFRVSGAGSIYAQNTTVYSISDQRLKENIVDANSQWDDIKALRFRNYNWKDDSGYADGKTYLGLIAQEVEPISPNLVEINAQTKEDIENEVPDPEYKNVKYSVVWMKAVKALQEAQARIETLEAKVAALEG